MKDWNRFLRCSFNRRVKDRPSLRQFVALRLLHIMVKTVQFVGTLQRVQVCLLKYHGFRLPLITLGNWPSSRTHTVSGIPGHFWLSCLLSFYFCAFPPSIWPYMVECFLSFHNPPAVTKTSTNSESHARPSSKTDQVCKSPSHRNIQRMQKEPGTEWLLWYR